MTDYMNGHLTAFACPLPTDPRKAQRVKLMEEAGEAFAAAQTLEKYESLSFTEIAFDCNEHGLKRDDVLLHSQWHQQKKGDLANELADVIQCCVNLAAIHNITSNRLNDALDACRRRNENRGRC